MAETLRQLRRPTLQETYTHLDEWLKSNKECHSAIAADSNIDAFDQSIKLIIIDKLRLHAELSQCIFSLDKGVVKRAVKCSWFFRATANKFFIEKVFPVVSVSTRLKVITVLAKNVDEIRANELYDYVRSQYGSRIAEPLLATCSKDRVCKILIDENRLVKPSTFLAVARRFPDFAVKVTKLWLQQERTVPDCIAKFLIRNQPNFIRNFTCEELSHLGLKMGRKLLRTVMNNDGNVLMDFGWSAGKLLKENGSFLIYFSEEAKLKALMGFIKSKARGSLSFDTWKSSLPDIKSQTKDMTTESRELLLQETFHSLFNATLWETGKAFSTTLLEMISPQKRSMLLQCPECNGEEFIYLHPPVVAIPKLISMVKRTPESSERAKLLEQMIESCRLMWDLEQLETVCIFAQEHIREEAPTILRLVEIILDRFESPKLPKAVWLFLAQMATILISEKHCQVSLLAAHEGLIGNCLNLGENVDSLVEVWAKDLGIIYKELPWHDVPSLQRPNAPQAQKLLNLIYPFLFKIAQNDLEHRVAAGFLDSASLLQFNLQLMPDKGEMIANFLTRSDVEDIVLSKAYRQKLYLFPCLLKHFTRKSHLLKHLLKSAPELVMQNFSTISSEIFSGEIYYFRNIDRFLLSKRLLCYYSLTDQITAECRKAFSNTDDPNSLSHILQVYSHFATMCDFEQLAKPFISFNPKLDLSDPNSVIIRSVPRMLRNINPINEAISFILPCLVGGGDLLFPALPAFHAFCYTQPIERTVEILLPYLEAPVSIKKKVLRILADVCTLDVTFSYLKDLWSRNKHYSVRIVLINCIVHGFLENPVEETWEFLRFCILDSDISTLQCLPVLSSIPDSYFSCYVETTWKALNDQKCNEGVKQEVIDHSRNRIELLDDTFCQKVIEQYLFTDRSIVNSFTVHYLMKARAISSDKLSFFATLLEERFQKSSRAVNTFVKEFCNHRYKIGFGEIFKELIRVFEKYFDSPKFFESRILLKYVEIIETIKQNSSCNDEQLLLHAIGNAIADYWRTVPDNTFMIPFFANSITEFCSVDYEPAHLLARVVCDDPVIAMAVLQALPKNGWYDPLVIKAPPRLDSIEITGDDSVDAFYSLQYILSFANSLSYPIVQQTLSSIVTNYRKHSSDE